MSSSWKLGSLFALLAAGVVSAAPQAPPGAPSSPAPAGVTAVLAVKRASQTAFENAELTLTVTLDKTAAPLRGLRRDALVRPQCVVAAGPDRKGKWAKTEGAAAPGSIDLLPGESFSVRFAVRLPEPAKSSDPDAAAGQAVPVNTTLQWVGTGPLKDLRSNEVTVAIRDGRYPIVTLETTEGEIVLELITEWAPNHVANFVTLAEKGFYDGLVWHRVVPNFVVQTGCPKGDGSGDPGYKIPAEFNDQAFSKGVLGMARGSGNDTAGSQFFVCVADAPGLNKQYTAFGRVLEGQDVADRIAVAPRAPNSERPMKDVVLKKAIVARPPGYVPPAIKKA
jgi:peptidyl-prolyl cis-trans isomerase B (cyclophilin B)